MKIDMEQTTADAQETLNGMISHTSVEGSVMRSDGTLSIVTTDEVFNVAFLPLFGWKVLEE